MAAIGLLSDSHGDLEAFDKAVWLLKAKGARRFVFLGGRYTDLDEWVIWKKEKMRGGRGYGDTDFLADVGAFLLKQDKPEPVPVGEDEEDEASISRIKDRFMRTPE